MKRIEIVTAALIAASTLGLCVSQAEAQSRPSTLNMSCGQAQSLVQSSGAIVLSTGRHTFDRFVSSRRFCAGDEEEVPTWAPTRDSAQCMVGSRCEPRRDWRSNR
jgi:hypothetical protein